MKPILETNNLKNNLKIATKRLLSGDLVIFPTETVYGIGADATNANSVKKIFIIKNRPINNPLICHFENLEKVKENATFNNLANKLAKNFWPGPLTLILKKKVTSKISPNVSNNNDLIGCRVPNNPIAQKILMSLNRPIAAPSANISTKLSSTNVNNIENKIKKNVFVIDGGICELGLESTVVDVHSNQAKILRYGSITIEQIKSIVPDIDSNLYKTSKPISPGQLYKHYSPNTPLRINVNEVKEGEVLLNFGLNNLVSNVFELNLSISGNLEEAAKNFFHYLHELDKKKNKRIAVAPIPNIGLGITMNDRLKRALVNNK